MGNLDCVYENKCLLFLTETEKKVRHVYSYKKIIPIWFTRRDDIFTVCRRYSLLPFPSFFVVYFSSSTLSSKYFVSCFGFLKLCLKKMAKYVNSPRSLSTD